MTGVSVVKVTEDYIQFSDGSTLSSHHDQDCCESHYLYFRDLSLNDFEGLTFDLSGSDFFEKVEDFGIRLVPINGHSVSVPGYGYNNGYYSSNLTLILEFPDRVSKWDIEECQKTEWG